TKFGKLEDSYNISNPRVITFLHDVLDEVCDLFPSKVIHIGGDEVLFGAWNESKEMQTYMQMHGLKTPADVQIKFTNEISNYLVSKGRRMMGWNEILGQNIHDFENSDDYGAQTELSKQSVIHFWRGEIPLITDAAQKGYEIVNSLHTETYLDYTYEESPLRRMYNFSPIPEGLEDKYHKNIIGIGVQMWTEWTPTHQDVEYQTYPRIAAVAEVAWSGSGEYQNFVTRMKSYSQRWIQKGINFPIEEIK
ncbi:MAG: family 20 glycosylhydrolase, partial [Bacteroidota bacterium]